MRKSMPALVVSTSTSSLAPIAIDTLGPTNTSDCQLFANLGRKISSTSSDDSFSVLQSFGAGATLQRCLVT